MAESEESRVEKIVFDSSPTLRCTALVVARAVRTPSASSARIHKAHAAEVGPARTPPFLRVRSSTEERRTARRSSAARALPGTVGIRMVGERREDRL